MRLVIHGISTMSRKVDGHAPVLGDRQRIEQLLEVGPVILAMTISDRHRLLALLNAFLLGLVMLVLGAWRGREGRQ